MTEPTCPRCAKPIHDQAYVCASCSRRLQVLMLATARLDPWTTIARLDVIIAGGVGMPDLDGWERNGDALEPIELPLKPEAAAKWRAASGELTTWCRHVAEERGLDQSGMLNPLAWLARHVGWLMHRQEAWEAYRAIEDACRAIRRIVDRHRSGRLVGWCADCQERLYADHGDKLVRCDGCEQTRAVADVRAELLEMARDESVTAAEAADAIIGEPGPERERLRALIRQWGHRELVAVADWVTMTSLRGTDRAVPRYRLGDLLDRWASALAARVA